MNICIACSGAYDWLAGGLTADTNRQTKAPAEVEEHPRASNGQYLLMQDACCQAWAFQTASSPFLAKLIMDCLALYHEQKLA